jgi:hypothetical protein
MWSSPVQVVLCRQVLKTDPDFVGQPNDRGNRYEPEGLGEYRDHINERRQGTETEPPRPYYPLNNRLQLNMIKQHTLPKIKSTQEIYDHCVQHEDCWAAPEVALESVNQFHRVLDQIAALRDGWKTQTAKIEGFEFDFWKRDPLAVVLDILGDADLADDFTWAPSKHYDHDGNLILTDIFTGDWCWSMQSKLHPGGGIPRGGSCTVVPIILSLDKVLFGSQSGSKTAWPVYITVGNVSPTKRWLPSSTNARLITLLPNFDGYSQRKSVPNQ